MILDTLGNTILITAASSEVGQAIALELSTTAAGLGLHYFINQRAVLALQAQLRENCQTLLLNYDLTHADNARLMIEQFVAEFGRIDVLINVMGPFVYEALESVTPESWDQTLAVNLNSCFYTTHYAIPYLLKSHGQIINFAYSGIENLKAMPMSTAYCAAKAGVAILTKSLAAALAPQGLRVNAICPGLVDDATIAQTERQTMTAQIPLGRPIYPQEIAKTVKWLIDESPESMTGSLIAVSGGWEY